MSLYNTTTAVGWNKGLVPESLKSISPDQLSAPFSGALGALKQKAWVRFLEVGVPQRKTESYTLIKPRDMEKWFEIMPSQGPDKTSDISNIQHDAELILVNGSKIVSQNTPEGIIIEPLAQAMENDKSLAHALTSLIEKEEDAFGAFCVAQARWPLLLNIRQDAIIPAFRTTLFVNDSITGMSRADTHLVIKAGSSSQSNIFIEYAGSGSNITSNIHIHIILESNARVNVTVLQTEGHSPNQYSKITAKADRDASLTVNNVSLGGAMSRQNTAVFLENEGAQASLYSAAAVKDEACSHHYIRVHHISPNTRSQQLYKNILKDKGRASVDGMVIVHKGAQLSDANQLINNLLLSDNARADTKPNLLIYADDVKCSHGATIGQLDKEQLFYLESRGLTQEDALSILTGSFLGEALENIPDKAIKKALTLQLSRQLTHTV